MRYTNINIGSSKVGQHLSTTKYDNYNLSISSFDIKKGLIQDKTELYVKANIIYLSKGCCAIPFLPILFYFALFYGKEGVKINIPDFLEMQRNRKSFLPHCWKTNQQLNKRFPSSAFFFITTFSFSF